MTSVSKPLREKKKKDKKTMLKYCFMMPIYKAFRVWNQSSGMAFINVV